MNALALLLLLLLLEILHLPDRMQIPPFALPVYLYLVIRGWCWILRRTNFVYLNCKIFFSWIYHHRLLVHWSGWNCGGNDDGFNGAEDEDQMTILSSVCMMNSTMVLCCPYALVNSITGKRQASDLLRKIVGILTRYLNYVELKLPNTMLQQ